MEDWRHGERKVRQVLSSKGIEIPEVKNVEVIRDGGRRVSYRDMASELCDGLKKAW